MFGAKNLIPKIFTVEKFCSQGVFVKVANTHLLPTCVVSEFRVCTCIYSFLFFHLYIYRGECIYSYLVAWNFGVVKISVYLPHLIRVYIVC